MNSTKKDYAIGAFAGVAGAAVNAVVPGMGFMLSLPPIGATVGPGSRKEIFPKFARRLGTALALQVAALAFNATAHHDTHAQDNKPAAASIKMKATGLAQTR